MPRRLFQSSGTCSYSNELIEARTGPSFWQRRRFRALAGSIPANIETKSARLTPASLELNERECDVLGWVATGKSDWQVAQILSVSPKTVNYHVENAKRKLGAGSRIQAVVEAVRLGYIDGRPG